MTKSVTHKCLLDSTLFSAAWSPLGPQPKPSPYPALAFTEVPREELASRSTLLRLAVYRRSGFILTPKIVLECEVDSVYGRLHQSDQYAVVEGLRTGILETIPLKKCGGHVWWREHIAKMRFDHISRFLADLGIYIEYQGVKPC